jgi:hypothetical protein
MVRFSPFLGRFKALMIATYGADARAEASPTAPKPVSPVATTSDASEKELSAWQEAVRLGYCILVRAPVVRG